MASRDFEISIPLSKKEWTTIVDYCGLKLKDGSISPAHEKTLVKWARDLLLAATVEEEVEEEETAESEERPADEYDEDEDEDEDEDDKTA